MRFEISDIRRGIRYFGVGPYLYGGRALIRENDPIRAVVDPLPRRAVVAEVQLIVEFDEGEFEPSPQALRNQLLWILRAGRNAELEEVQRAGYALNVPEAPRAARFLIPLKNWIRRIEL